MPLAAAAAAAATDSAPHPGALGHSEEPGHPDGTLDVVHLLFGSGVTAPAACLSVACRRGRGAVPPFATTLWRSSLLLALHLRHQPAMVAGHSVLELGAGTGVAGLTAALLGARRVVLTDLPQGGVQSAERSVRLNPRARPATGGVEVLPLDWAAADAPAMVARLGSPFPDLLLAADCVFQPDMFVPFVQTLALLLHEAQARGRDCHPLALMAYENRSPYRSLAETLAFWGLVGREVPLPPADLGTLREVACPGGPCSGACVPSSAAEDLTPGLFEDLRLFEISLATDRPEPE
ncbi:hypothetical protein H696_01454 [Fonticula alba]|uniref:Uncharacterized protein n=1 Tax=Fonticula alba TaxID=691883 RepID=A0A058ZDL1_FONAL|nr:hypothetical protein H696_01454 [Fonticula alba]KCV72046.1 hypothetical protein H696_01454 [Fonticula alba]|eukprot:XP_009493624.1 hypothetical protein H696_01454 [Fonticula alba]